MASMGTIGNVLNAAAARRMPMCVYWNVAVFCWHDSEAYLAIASFTANGMPVNGDEVTLKNSMGGFKETRTFVGCGWIAMGAGTYPFPRSTITTSRKGYKDWSDIAAVAAIRDAGKDFPIDGDAVTLYDDTWTSTRYYKDGKWIEDSLYFPGVLSAPAAPSQPGIGDEVKPDLMSKRLRNW